MTLFKYRLVPHEGLHAMTGSLAVTRGVFHIETLLDPLLKMYPKSAVDFTQHHEYAHAKYKHGLLAVLCFPFRESFSGWAERVADRYAAAKIGYAATVDALRCLYPEARNATEARLYGRTWRDRLERAGI